MLQNGILLCVVMVDAMVTFMKSKVLFQISSLKIQNNKFQPLTKAIYFIVKLNNFQSSCECHSAECCFAECCGNHLETQVLSKS